MSLERWVTDPMIERADDAVRLQPFFVEIADTGDADSVNTVQHGLGRIPRGLRVVNKVYTPDSFAISGTGKRAGDIFLSGESSAPSGSLNCDGTAVSRTTYATLFARIGTTFGVGDGSTTFNLPDFRRRTPVGKGGSGTGTLGNSLGNTGGAETHTLVTSEIPAHSHTVTDPGHSHSIDTFSSTGSGDAREGAPPSSPGTLSTTSETTGITIDDEGGDGAHNNVQPSLISSFYIQYDDVSVSGSGSGIPLDWYRLSDDNAWTARNIFIRFNLANVRVLLEVF